jgi:asparagine synthase (glutamine-hydrolysing)
MCGIAGFLSSSQVADPRFQTANDLLARMLRSVEHRGPDDWGTAFFGFNEAGAKGSDHLQVRDGGAVRVALGHRRLSILDLSVSGRQPMMSVDKSVTITFNGEIYNYVELREELEDEFDFHSGTDTEVLLNAYRRWGTEMLPRLDGMFSFAIWDEKRQELICARDPLSIKPFYYGSGSGTFFFGSEPAAVLAGLDTQGSVDLARIAEFLVLDVSDHDEGTSFQEVSQLPGGYWIAVGADGVRSEPRAYWTPPAGLADVVDVAGETRHQLMVAVSRQLRSDVPVGSCLSGGLDSGSIVAAVGEQLGPAASDFKALTLTTKGFAGDESALAALTAQRAKVRWIPVTTDPQRITDDLEHLVRIMGEPFGSLSMYGQYNVMRAARDEGLKVMLDGQGGDEVFLGYNTIAQRIVGEHFRHGRLGQALREMRGLHYNASHSMLRTLAGNILFSSPTLAIQRGRRRMSPFVSGSLLDGVRFETASARFSGADFRTLQVRDLRRFVLPRLLKYEDRNSMAFSLEARVPLLAIPLVELGLSLPLEWQVRDGWTKFALRQGMTSLLPGSVVWNRKKRGFEVPQADWVSAARKQIAGWISELPHDCGIRREQIVKGLDAGLGGRQWFWRCISLALWLRHTGVKI